jgi:hypothetical protein
MMSGFLNLFRVAYRRMQGLAETVTRELKFVENLGYRSAIAVSVPAMLGMKHSPARGLVCLSAGASPSMGSQYTLVGCEINAFVNRGTLKVMRMKKSEDVDLGTGYRRSRTAAWYTDSRIVKSQSGIWK